MKKRISLVGKTVDTIMTEGEGNHTRIRPNTAIASPNRPFVILAETANRFIIKHEVDDAAAIDNTTLVDIVSDGAGGWSINNLSIGPALRATIRTRLLTEFPQFDNLGELFDAASIDNRAKLARFVVRLIRKNEFDDFFDLVRQQDWN
jgi:hypothetical protein